MKPAVDEMFPEGAGPYVDLDEAGGSSGLLMDLAANEKAVHSDFFNGGVAPCANAQRRRADPFAASGRTVLAQQKEKSWLLKALRGGVDEDGEVSLQHKPD
uniref:COP9 signalosome complex subunit 9 n=1 Tax=Oryzias sinensis TaxID=183150 RepID=A0A8C7Y6J6_9TELE